MSEPFEIKEWEDKFGEFGEDLEFVFEYGLAIAEEYPYATRRLDTVLDLDEEDPDRIRELVESIYDQCQQGLIETPALFDASDGLDLGIDADSHTFTGNDLKQIYQKVSKPFDWQEYDDDKLAGKNAELNPYELKIEHAAIAVLEMAGSVVRRVREWWLLKKAK